MIGSARRDGRFGGKIEALSLFGDKIKDGVEAEAEVLKMAPTAKAARQEGKRNVDYEFRLRVEGPAGAEEVDHTTTVPWRKLPAAGQRLPVTVSASDPRKLRIEWDKLPDTADRFRAAAAAAEEGDPAAAARALGFEPKDPPS